MNTLPSLFLENDAIDAEMEAFCRSDPEYLEMKQRFDEASEEIAKLVGFNVYDAFERSFWDYFFHTANLYYLFGLGLRQEILQAMGK